MLSAEQREHFARHGFVVLRGMFSSDELSKLRPPPASSFKGIEQPVFERCVVFGNPETDEDPEQIVKLEGLGRLADNQSGAGIRQLGGLHRLCHDPRLVCMAKQLLNNKTAELMKDKFIFKAAGGGGGFPPHQDMTFIYSRVCTDAINFGIAFDDADAENGALEVAPNMHAQLAGRHILPTTETKMTADAVTGVDFQYVDVRAGDCIVFSAWLLHRSSVNKSVRDRAVYYVTYGVPGNLEGGQQNTATRSLYANYYELYDAWIASGYAKGKAADMLLGADRPRPSLISDSAMGVGIASADHATMVLRSRSKL